MLFRSLKFVDKDYNIISYGRFNRKSAIVVLVNNNNHEVIRELSIWHLGIPKESIVRSLILTTAEGFSTEPREYPVISGKITLNLPKTSAIVLKYE